MTTRSSSKPTLDKKQLEFDSSSDEDNPTPQRPTRQAYRTFNGTKEQERVMLLTALRRELSAKATKFIKTNLQQHQKNRILRNIQDDDTDFEKISAQASRAFSITWIKQLAPGKLQYKPQILAKYANNAKNTTTTKKTPPSPMSGRKKQKDVQIKDVSDEVSNESASESDSENLLEEDPLEDLRKTPPPLTQPMTQPQTSPPVPPSNLNERKPSTTDPEDSPFSYASITREVDHVNQILDEAATTTWKQEMEIKLQNQTKTTIAIAKEEILETINTTKGELLTQLDILRADIKEHETTLDQKTRNAETISLRLQEQQADMEKLSQNIQKQQADLQEHLNTFQQRTNAERKQTQATREEVRKGFKWDIEQASRHYLVQHEKKSDAIMLNARTKQTEQYRQSCRSIQKEYKRKIEQKYEELESESMQFADQAILDLGDLLHQEKNNILDEVKHDIPPTIMNKIKQEITTKLETTLTTHTEALKEQRKTTITQIQKAAKRHTEQMETQQRNLQTAMQQERESIKEEHLSETIEAIKTKASTAFSLDLQSQVQQQLQDFNHLISTKTVPSTPPRTSHVPLTSQYWTETMKQTTSPLPARPSPDTPAQQPVDRFKLARSKELESKLPNFRKDQMYIHLPNEPLQHYMEAFYETLATMMNNYDFPIVLLQDLEPRGSTCPLEAYETYERETLMKISRALYQKLLGVIPHTCTIMHNLLANHAATQDGYKALYAMMRLKCTYLQDLLPTWGPTWQTGSTAFEYVSNIHSYLTQERRRNKYYTEFEVAAEMVQQAKRHPEYQLLAGAYMAQIIAMPTDQNEMAPEFHTDNLALNFESNKQILNLPNNPVVNKFGQPRKEGSNERDGGRRQHQYKNPVQCASCKLFGHCIDTQVCRFSAQIIYAQEYIAKNADKAKSNAEAYNAANNKTKVNKIYQQFPEKFDDFMTEEERENTRYELASTFFNQTHDNTDP
jgi:hypothetical protein